MKTQKTFLFDLDDTLIPNQHSYSYPLITAWEFIVEKVGYRAPDLQNFVNFAQELDHADVEKLGWKMERFPTAVREAFRQTCESFGIAPTSNDLEKAYAIGSTVFDESAYKKNGLLPGARTALEFLALAGDELILVTKGDSRVQNAKIAGTGLRQWFSNRVHITLNKTPQLLDDIIAGRDKSVVWHVGNSIRSDMLVAQQAGIGMIYVPCETWAYERQHNGVPTDYERLITIETIKDIPDIYAKL